MKVRIIVYSSLLMIACTAGALLFFPDLQFVISAWWSKKTIDQRVTETLPIFEANLKPKMIAVGLTNPIHVTLVFFKDEKVLNLYAGEGPNGQKFIKSYPVTAASGRPGPKLREGDRQVPEGIYSVESLNPNSMFYLSLRVNYPNEIDRERGKLDNRENLGSDIMIHGSDASIGCVAIGNEAIAEIFHLAGTTNLRNWKLLFAPTDLTKNPAPREVLEKLPWMASVYKQLAEELSDLTKKPVRIVNTVTGQAPNPPPITPQNTISD